MILTDTGPLVAILDHTDRHHAACVAALSELTAPMVTTWPVLARGVLPAGGCRAGGADADRAGHAQGHVVVHDIADPARLLELLRKYGDRPMDLADGSLVVLAEQLRLYRVFTLDRTDFRVYRAWTTRL